MDLKIFSLLLLCSTCSLSSDSTSSPSIQQSQESTTTTSSDEIVIQPRVANGRTARVGDVPYQIQIRNKDAYLCGGALTESSQGKQIVITSGRCVTKKSGTTLLPVKEMQLVGGRLYINGTHVYEQFRNVTSIRRHPDYRCGSYLCYHDIAVLHISEPFELNRLVQTIPMPTVEKSRPKGHVVISGWGYVYPTVNVLAEVLQAGILAMVDDNKCRDIYSHVFDDRLWSSHFCAGTPRNPNYQGACKGDEGSPAVAYTENNLYLAGTFNYGEPKCGNRYQPSIFTDLSFYFTWVNKVSVGNLYSANEQDKEEEEEEEEGKEL